MIIIIIIITVSDINECQEMTADCTQLCSNAVGNYTCSCLAGHQLNSDQRTCTDGKQHHWIQYHVVIVVTGVTVGTKVDDTFSFTNTLLSTVIQFALEESKVV